MRSVLPRPQAHRIRPGATLVLPLAALLAGCAPDAAPTTVGDADFCATIHRDTSLTLDGQLQPVDSLMARRTGVYVLEDGGGAMITRAWLSEYAEHTVDVQYFIFSADNVGLIAADYLVRAADRGVRVRILVDDVLVEADAAELLALDAHPNLEIRIYNPGTNVGKNLPQKALKVISDFRGANQRMHNKTFTVDGRVSITGGRNIADEYFDYDHEYNFRDRDVLLLGRTAAGIDSVFERFWNDPLSHPVGELVRATAPDSDSAARLAWLHEYACKPANYWPQVRGLLSGIPAAFKGIQASGALQWVDSVTFVSDVPGKNDGRQGLEWRRGHPGRAAGQLVRQARRTRSSSSLPTWSRRRRGGRFFVMRSTGASRSGS